MSRVDIRTHASLISNFRVGSRYWSSSGVWSDGYSRRHYWNAPCRRSVGTSSDGRTVRRTGSVAVQSFYVSNHGVTFHGPTVLFVKKSSRGSPVEKTNNVASRPHIVSGDGGSVPMTSPPVRPVGTSRAGDRVTVVGSVATPRLFVGTSGSDGGSDSDDEGVPTRVPSVIGKWTIHRNFGTGRDARARTIRCHSAGTRRRSECPATNDAILSQTSSARGASGSGSIWTCISSIGSASRSTSSWAALRTHRWSVHVTSRLPGARRGLSRPLRFLGIFDGSAAGVRSSPVGRSRLGSGVRTFGSVAARCPSVAHLARGDVPFQGGPVSDGPPSLRPRLVNGSSLGRGVSRWHNVTVPGPSVNGNSVALSRRTVLRTGSKGHPTSASSPVSPLSSRREAGPPDPGFRPSTKG